MNFFWAINRIKSMNFEEIVFRFIEKYKKINLKNFYEGWNHYNFNNSILILSWTKKYIECLSLNDRNNIYNHANELLNGSYKALNINWPNQDINNLFPNDLWRLDPVTNKYWPGPDKYCFDINYRHEKNLGDIKYVWEINRLQFLQSLAALFYFTKDIRAITAIEDSIESWYQNNPPFRGLGWTSGIEIALRSISLLVVVNLLYNKLSHDIQSKICAILAASFFWLNRFPSKFSSANNHAIAEHAAKLLISQALPGLPRASSVFIKSKQALEFEAINQFHTDGVPAEQSPSYGAFSAELLWLCHQLSPLNKCAYNRLLKFSEYIYWLTDANNKVPSIGDDDEGRVLCFLPRSETYPFEVCSRFTPYIYQVGFKIFDKGGYSVIKKSRWHVIFDHGDLGYLSIAAHGHADALSLCISIDGIPLLIDPGTYLYHSGREERDWFRGTSSHNTLNIDGINQSIISGPFNWSHKANCALEEFDETLSSLTASHDGYHKKFHTRHRRKIQIENEYILIQDFLIGKEYDSQIVFQFSSEFDIFLKNNIACINHHNIFVANIIFSDLGYTKLEHSYISPRFGIKVIAPRIIWNGIVDNNGIITRINLF